MSNRPRRRTEAGYNMVVMVIVITAFNVMVASAWPLWSAFAQREKEEELIFRGMQYAEAIRVFQKRFGRYPNRLEELVKVEPRCLRQLWNDPMAEDGDWGLIFGPAPGDKGGRAGGRGGRMGKIEEAVRPGKKKFEEESNRPDPGSLAPGGAPGSGLSGDGRPAAAAPITGVFSKSDESGFKTFFGQSSYREWKFTVDLVSQPPMGPTGVRTPHVGKRTLGKPFRGEISSPGGGLPGSGKGRPGSPDQPVGPGG